MGNGKTSIPGNFHEITLEIIPGEELPMVKIVLKDNDKKRSQVVYVKNTDLGGYMTIGYSITQAKEEDL